MKRYDFDVPKRFGVLILRCALPAILVAAALAITQSLKNPVFPTPLFFAAIVISTWFAGGVPGLIAVVLAAYRSLAERRPVDVEC